MIVKSFLYLIIFLSAHILIAQTTLKKVIIEDISSVRKEKIDEAEIKYFNLQKIDTSPYKFHFRYKQVGQIVDVYSHDSTNFKGMILNKIIRLKYIKKDGREDSVPECFVYEILEIKDSLASEIGKWIIGQKLYDIPTDSLLSGWKSNFLDCSGIEFKFKAGDAFYTKKYGCPNGQDTVQKDINNVLTLNKRLMESLHLGKKYSEFTHKLEGGKSYTNELYMTMYIMTEEQHNSWNKYKPERDYLASVKDSIDTYLQEKVGEKYVVDELDCFEDYYLEFSKNGKLRSISINEPFFERLFDTEYYKCRKKIKKLFKGIDLKHLSLKYGFWRVIHFSYDGTFFIYDNTTY